MRVRLMLTCLCDAFYGEVGIAAVRVLEHAGCTVEFDDRQTCCGQPPFNAGDWEAARSIASRCSGLFEGGVPVVVASTSCAAMLHEGFGLLGVRKPNAYELSSFLLDELGVDKWPIRGSVAFRERTVAFHRACHSRVLGLGDTQERLLSLLPGVHLVRLEQDDQCCGFGGAFSATHGTLSAGIGIEKLRNVLESGADTVVSGDMGCLMHLNGLIERESVPVRTAHYAQLLSEAIA